MAAYEVKTSTKPNAVTFTIPALALQSLNQGQGQLKVSFERRQKWEKKMSKVTSVRGKAKAPAHPLLRALGATKNGGIEVQLPDGESVVCQGVESGPRAKLEVRDYSALDRVISHGDIGLGEGYILGLWDTDDIKELMRFVANNYDVLQAHANGARLHKFLYALKHKLRPNSRKGSRRNIHAHYDLGNEFYSLWLDESYTYSCALFEGDEERPLEVAQKAKYQRILDRIAPMSSDHILEIGCGWGGFMEQAAANGCRVTGVTISTEQARFAQDRLKSFGAEQYAEVLLQDYREISQKFNHVVSIGMMEHVGERYWSEYMAKINDSLKPGGKAMVQTIIISNEQFESYRKNGDFIREHIFPGGMLPSPDRIVEEANKARLEVNDIFAFGEDYAITLEKWLARFDSRVLEIRSLGYGEDFIRKWRFYLASCAAMFRAGKLDVLQVELGKEGVKDEIH